MGTITNTPDSCASGLAGKDPEAVENRREPEAFSFLSWCMSRFPYTKKRKEKKKKEKKKKEKKKEKKKGGGGGGERERELVLGF